MTSIEETLERNTTHNTTKVDSGQESISNVLLRISHVIQLCHHPKNITVVVKFKVIMHPVCL